MHVSFSVNKGGTDQTVPTAGGAITKLTWSTEAFDTNNNFAGSRFTPTVAGKYLITVQVHASSSMEAYGALGVLIYKNGSLIQDRYEYNFGSNQSPSVNITAIVDMNGTTDYLEAYAYAYQPSGYTTTISGYPSRTVFSGSLLSP